MLFDAVKGPPRDRVKRKVNRKPSTQLWGNSPGEGLERRKSPKETKMRGVGRRNEYKVKEEQVSNRQVWFTGGGEPLASRPHVGALGSQVRPFDCTTSNSLYELSLPGMIEIYQLDFDSANENLAYLILAFILCLMQDYSLDCLF